MTPEQRRFANLRSHVAGRDGKPICHAFSKTLRFAEPGEVPTCFRCLNKLKTHHGRPGVARCGASTALRFTDNPYQVTCRHCAEELKFGAA